MSDEYEQWPDPILIVGSIAEGYRCPKDDTPLTLLTHGAWCSACHTVWRELDEVSLADLDDLPEAHDGR